MNKAAAKSIECQVCKRRFRRAEMVPASMVRESLAAFIQREVGSFDPEGSICLEDMRRLRARHVESLLADERGELSALDADVVRSLHRHEIVAREANKAFEGEATLGERLADGVAAFGGSWTFILVFAAVLASWIAINTLRVSGAHFDPYPYILLNLVLSCLAALQAPVIMMSQNRQEAKDRLRAEHDYKVNLKAELEIRHLHEKVDHLLLHQWDRLMEIQQSQMDLLEEIARLGGKKS